MQEKMEAFNTYCNVLGWIVISGCSMCILFSIIGLFYLLIKKLIMKSTDWDAIAKRHKKSQEALNYMAEHPLTYDEAVQQGIKLKNMSLEDEIKRYTEEKYHETFGNGQGTLDEFDWEDIDSTIEETARHFAEWGAKQKSIEIFKKQNCQDCGTQKCTGDGEWLEGCVAYKKWKAEHLKK